MKKVWSYLYRKLDNGVLDYALVLAIMGIVVMSIVEILAMTTPPSAAASGEPKSTFVQENAAHLES